MSTQVLPKPQTKVRDLCYIALMAALMAVCSWITVPFGPVPFTMQTFAIFAALLLLGGKRGTIAVLAFILLAAVGAPVLSGFHGGLSALLGMTGGYIVGFLFSALAMWGVERVWGRGLIVLGASMVLGLLVCYAFGTAWFMVVYARGAGAITLGAALTACVVPYILPDLVKIALALAITARLRPHVR